MSDNNKDEGMTNDKFMEEFNEACGKFTAEISAAITIFSVNCGRLEQAVVDASDMVEGLEEKIAEAAKEAADAEDDMEESGDEEEPSEGHDEEDEEEEVLPKKAPKEKRITKRKRDKDDEHRKGKKAKSRGTIGQKTFDRKAFGI